MRVFVSYRRDDTAGRAGRLFDGLVAHLGADNVFQDVSSIEPGVDFDDAVRSAIAHSDATLVVIGSQWATIRNPGGGRRLDDPDDYVRREVCAALAAGGSVVPVLVDDATLPTADDLADELRSLAKRQAVSLRDATWGHDLEGLMRRLVGDARRRKPASRRRVIALGAFFVAVVIAVAGWLLTRGTGGSPSTESVIPPCSVPDATWTNLDVATTASASYEVNDAEHHRLQYVVQHADSRPKGSGWEVVLRVEHANQTDPVEGTFSDDSYFSPLSLRELFVDRLSQGKPTCFSLQTGDKEVAPGKRAIALFGYQSSIDPTAVSLEVTTYDQRAVVITR